MARLWTSLKAKTAPDHLRVNDARSACETTETSRELLGPDEHDIEAIDSAKARRRSQLIDELEADRDRLQEDSYLFGSVAHRPSNIHRSGGMYLVRGEESDSKKSFAEALQRENKALRNDLRLQQQTINQRNAEIERLQVQNSEIKAEVFLQQVASNQQGVALEQHQIATEQMNAELRAAHGQIRTLTRQLSFAGATNVVTRNETMSLLRQAKNRERLLEEANEELLQTNRRSAELQRSNAHLRTEFEEIYSQHVLFMSHFEQIEEDESQESKDATPEQAPSSEAIPPLDTTAS
ncbi:unnamed protein product [Zymoseptoria tritici ST99CH_1E4]|uniref:Autophagy-related protein 16 domain-containing protein n=1 Tax=Zymoseptoria tritici ST99CH_1E4 TaxID=1276532 RepID=A0A2H1FMI0_ZYMTR|nr:unnamed protein product [Zymoseptoria tritici ST99CH_1E4]